MIRTIAILVLLAATAAHAQLTTTVKRIRLEHATAAELAGTTLDLGHAVFNEENLADFRIGDGETPGGVRVGSDWWKSNMLSAWGGLSRVDVEALVALSIPHVDLTPYALSADLAAGSIYPATATNSYIRPDGGTNTIYFDAASNMVIAVDGSPSITISPAGNVGLNVDEPEAQLDVGGNVLVRSNLVAIHGLQIGDEAYGYNGRIRVYNDAEGRFDEFGQLAENTFSFGASDGPKYGFTMDGKFGGNVTSPWYDIGDYANGVVFGNSLDETTNRASIKVSVNPPGFIFNVNGVIWTNTP